MNMTAKKGIVYVVDDDEAVRDSLQWLLEGKDYRVRCFESAEAFLARYDPREVACLIADIRMHGMTGLELQDKLIPLHQAMFAEPSPAGAKYAVSLLGLCSEECRLPVMPLSDATRERIRAAMQALNLL